jgi:regulation of enolase protein 1 (concanavalin A-like superfamily)
MNIQHVLKAILALALAAPGMVVAQQSVGGPGGVFTGSSDIGKTRAGSTVYEPASSIYRVTGGGADMWGAADAFHFSWVRLSGDATLTADVHFPSGPLAPLEKAVLIIRQSLDPASAYADVAIHADGHITLQYRSTAGGNTADVTAAERGSTRLRIERTGNRFTAYTGSADGKLTAFSISTIAMDDPVYVGIGVCAHDAEGLTTVTFSNVSIEHPSGPPAAKKEQRQPPISSDLSGARSL